MSSKKIGWFVRELEIDSSRQKTASIEQQKSAVADADDANTEADTSQKPTVASRCLLGSALSSRPNSGV
uniref:Uncharacterized protein n=1 Tax=Vespula pensylvanica TaxID=30213 RepID=A0A834U9V9_VESPE|nr:hypothetical protein H0235_007747 [Vespula pensylvanica]